MGGPNDSTFTDPGGALDYSVLEVPPRSLYVKIVRVVHADYVGFVLLGTKENSGNDSRFQVDPGLDLLSVLLH